MLAHHFLVVDPALIGVLTFDENCHLLVDLPDFSSSPSLQLFFEGGKASQVLEMMLLVPPNCSSSGLLLRNCHSLEEEDFFGQFF